MAERTGFGLSRRDFMQRSIALAAGLPLAARAADPAATMAQGAGRDVIRLGVVGCGGRGTGAVMNCIEAAPNVELVAMGEMFADRLEMSRKRLADRNTPRINVTDETCFVGWDAIDKVLACDIDLVILAAPPGFRPEHLRKAIAAGKHVFAEKPVCVDPVGARSVIETSEMAERMGLAIVAGTQRRHSPIYQEVMRRVHGGEIGEVVAGQFYWIQGGLWHRAPEDGQVWSEMETQMRNWLYYDWLSGDHIVEQHVHQIDVMNWAMDGPPEKCIGQGGRISRTDPKYGNIYDHFSVEYEFANGVRMNCMCRQIEGSNSRIAERIVGARGVAIPSSDRIEGQGAWEYAGEKPNPLVLEHIDLITSIMEGKPINQGRRIAESCLTAIMGRMAAYSGREISWNWALNASQLDLTPARLELGPMPVRPVPVPGQSELV